MKRNSLTLEKYKQLTDEEREVLRQEKANAFLQQRLDALKEKKSKPKLVQSASTPARRFVKGRVRSSAKPMTKTQLIAALAEEMGTDTKSAVVALNAITGLITREVSGGGAVTLPGVGKIYCRERPERQVRNPATGEQFKKEAEKVVKMTIAKALKDAVEG